MRVLFLLLAVLLVGWLIRSWLRSSTGEQRAASTVRKPKSTKNLGVLVACAYCNVHVPRDEAVLDGDMVFCDEAHRAAHHRTPHAK
jgi:uncharacterized protein